MTFKDDQELKSLDSKSLLQEIEKAKAYLNGISFDHQQGNLKDTTQLKKTRRYIAAMKTFLNTRKETSETSVPSKSKKKKE